MTHLERIAEGDYHVRQLSRWIDEAERIARHTTDSNAEAWRTLAQEQRETRERFLKFLDALDPKDE